MSVQTDSTVQQGALSHRARSVATRVAIMAVIAAMLWTLTDWRLAPFWWIAYAALQWATVHMAARHANAEHPRRIYALITLSYTVAGFPVWHMWTQAGEMGSAAATMFLAGMLVQLVVSSLDSGRLFWAGSSPLIGYLILVPTLAFGSERLREGLAVTGCAILLVFYLIILWRSQQRALVALRESRRTAEAAQRAAELASQAKTDFLATMSHEVRTPMNAVLGATDLLGRTNLTEEQQGLVTLLADGGAILMHILNDVLDLSKIEAGKLALDPTETDPHEFIRRCSAIWAPRARDKGLDFRLTIAKQVPPLVAMDALRVGQIVFNLISNSLKFTDTGKVTLELDLVPLAPGRADLLIRVSDTGIGMSQAAISQLFTAFQQADGSISRRFGGTGLGLSIGQKLAEMMGGEISVESTEGLGSTFTLRIPVAVTEARQVEPTPTAENSDETIPLLRILVAEDNAANQRIIDLFLRPLGAEVTIVGDGSQALDALAVTPFDLVLMDMQMPVMDGLEATRRLRSSTGINAQIPVIALTANVMEAQRKACFDAGMTAHVAKPIDARLLLSAVLAAVDPNAQSLMLDASAAA